jgi:uncharacterized membrane protein YbhN (UPF0104 family)
MTPALQVPAQMMGRGVLPTRQRPRRVRWTLIAAFVPLVAIAWLIVHWATVDRGTDTLATGNPGWLGLAAIAAAFTWVAGAVCQQGAVVQSLPRVKLLLVQIAGSLANHVLPSGVGVGAVNTRFLQRQGLTTRAAIAAVGVNTLAGLVVHAVVLAVLVGAGLAPFHLRTTWDLLLVGVVLAGVLLVVVLVPAARARVKAVGRSAVAEFGALSGQRARLWQLWLGSAGVPFLHAATLVCVGRAIGLPLGVGALLGIYFVSSALAGLVPSPGGFGSLDAALTLALTSAGVPTATAVATTLGYRVLTVWIPLAPSTAVFLFLLRRKVI